jgi:guanylate kinase
VTLVVLAAPSGVGKTTIAQLLAARRPDVGFSVSATTRAPRPGEVDGRDYHFIPRPEFERRVRAGAFLEWAQYAGELYGTLRSEVDRIERAGRHPLLDIEVQGAEQVRSAYPPPRSLGIFLLPPSAAELLRRLRERRSEDPAGLARRVDRAVHELEHAPAFERIIVNDVLDDAVARVSAAIDGAERPGRPAAAGRLVEPLIEDLRDLARQLAAEQRHA